MLSGYKKQYEKSLYEEVEKVKKEISSLKINENKCEDNIVALVAKRNGQWKLINNYILKKDREKFKRKVRIPKKIKTTKVIKKYRRIVKRRLKRIVIILESPHKEEYSIDNKMGYPALGITGININKGIEEVINTKLSYSMEHNKYYEIILINAIQYQTSLGIDTNMLRDRTWIYLWLQHNMRDGFIKRIKGYRPNIIVNFCTKGNHSKDVLSFITDVETTVIKDKFIESLNIKNLKCNKDKILVNGKLVCEVERNTKGKSQGYTLRNFVNNAIKEAFGNIEILKGPHPSLWKFDKYDKDNKCYKLKKETLDDIIIKSCR